MAFSMHNPFTIGIVESPDDFCNRKKEIGELIQHAHNGTNVVMFSPRRYGKSSLVTVVQKQLASEGMVTAYVDLFPITTQHDLVTRLATALFKSISRDVDPRTFLNKAKNIFRRVRPNISFTGEGFSLSVDIDSHTKPPLLLDELMEGLGSYVKNNKLKASVALDEFQEITDLPEAKKIEGILRSHMQFHKTISYFFVGSKRRVLKDMFTLKSRPFYKSAFLYPLSKIPQNEFIDFICERFKATKKICPPSIAESLYQKVEGYPYYVQKLSSILWDQASHQVTEEDLNISLKKLIHSETPDFQAYWEGLTTVQRQLLKALALAPYSEPFSKSFLKQFELSLGGVQKAIDVLFKRDLIEKIEDGITLTDPVMAAWLKEV